MRGVILYGPPAAGKDTVTQALCQLNRRYALFRRLKAGPGRTAGYRMTTEQELAKLRRQGDIIWENRRYGATYVVDRPSLSALISARVPVLHLGQVEAIEAVKNAVPAIWLVVYVWCARDVAADRIANRRTGDIQARIRAWDETESIEADLVLDTAITTPERAAREVDQALFD